MLKKNDVMIIFDRYYDYSIKSVARENRNVIQSSKRVKITLTGCALFYKPIWQLTVNERGHYADSEDTFLFKIEDSPDTRLGA